MADGSSSARVIGEALGHEHGGAHRLTIEDVGFGNAVVMISSELPEILGMCDRILVMSEGRVVSDFMRETATKEAIMSNATGSV